MLNLTNDEVLNYDPDVEDNFLGTNNEKSIPTFLEDIKSFINKKKKSLQYSILTSIHYTQK